MRPPAFLLGLLIGLVAGPLLLVIGSLLPAWLTVWLYAVLVMGVAGWIRVTSGDAH